MATTDNSSKCACSAKVSAENKTPKKKRSIGDSIKLGLTALAFAAIPKCPVCLAGYIALGTGIGLSITTATYLRTGLIIACIVSFAYFIIKHVGKFILHADSKK